MQTTSPASVERTGSSGSVTSPHAYRPVPLWPSDAPGPQRTAAERAAVSTKSRISAYVALTKPRIIELLLVTTIPTMILAQGGMPGLWLVLATLIGGTLSAASANVFNCYFDRDIDEVMNRTKRRPLVTGEVSPVSSLVFASVLGIASILWLGLLVNWVSALLSALAILMYVVGYTILLKRRTSQNIVWGGMAGCMPVLIGWSAVTGSVAWPPFLLFGVIFFWTPPHYWPLSMKFRKDYANAGVPMLPVVANDTRVAVEMVLYTLAMIACSLLMVLEPLGGLSWVYAIVASALGLWFLYECIGLLRRARQPGARKLGAMRVFHASITYLTLLSIAIVVDVFLPF